MQEIKNEYETVIRNAAELDVSHGWHLDNADDNGVLIRYKQTKGVATVSLQMEVEVEIPYDRLMALACEPDLYSKYVPFCESARTIKDVSKGC